MSNFKPIEKKTASDQVADLLRRHILRGEIEPGERLPPERTLATQFNVTRTTLREALKKLEQLKLIGVRQGQGITVKDFRTASMDLLNYLLHMEGIIDEEILHNILEARVLLGSEVARLAAERATAQDIADLEKALEHLAACRGDREYQLKDFEFFRVLALASHNIVYTLLMNTIKRLHRANIELFLPLTPSLSIAVQQQILDAVKAGEAEAAASVAREYLHKGMSAFPRPDFSHAE